MSAGTAQHDNAAAIAPLGLAATLMHGYPGPALICDAAGSVLTANAAAAELAGAMAGGRLGDAVALVARAAASGEAAVDLVGLSAAGTVRLLDCQALPALDGRVLLLAKDVTLERNLRSALFESRQRYKDLVEISSDFAWEVGADGAFAFVSPRGALGYPADAMVGRQADVFVVEHEGVETLSPFLVDHAVEDAEVWMRRADGGLAFVLAAAAPILGPAGEWRGARGVCRDVTGERARDAALARASNRERLLTYVVRTIRDVVDPSDMLTAAVEATGRAVGARGCVVLRTDGDRRHMAPAARFGSPGDAAAAAALAERDHVEMVDGEHRVLGAVSRYRSTVNGAILLWRDAGQAEWSDDERLLCDAVATQIGIAIEQIANHERILQLSRTDALTGLYNRRAFFEELSRRFQRLSRDRRCAALIYCDLDNFKLVNDAHGHQCGDEALIAVRDLLVGNTRPIDLLARLGGDEFALWLEGADEAIASKRCTAIVKAARRLERYSGTPDQPLHLSLGLAVHDPERPESMEDLLCRADKAMYQAKREGKGTWALAPPAEEQP